ncbi:forkhead box protein R1 isoform X2 [Periophthalmus magnuspinnatus]|uniref:forkhead box protein R1 isoform X2 n=1 Tax=Periophthalmus magnuspinnatus TaxID=409849 RepID=UPI002436E8D9|nr:forkhead box protein R1 isoform X2 [Periophthalmus magnuspinnatus]
MSFRLQTRGRLLDLHCSVALTEWDLDQELRLQITTDQDERSPDSLQRPMPRSSRRNDDLTWYDKASDVFVKPNLWLMVNPNIVCPLHYLPQAPPPQPQAPPPTLQTTPPSSHDAPLQNETSSTNPHMISSEAPCIETAKTRRKPRTSQWSNRWAPGCSSWPRPPVNYCLLIGLALKYNGSLRVQQIYNFTKELFPFFQTAPDGWKNTIRHNLCFNHSFKKTFTQSRGDREQQGRQSGSEGKRKSCCWLLTSDGHQRLREELLTLTPETLKQLERSAANPDLIRALLSL